MCDRNPEFPNFPNPQIALIPHQKPPRSPAPIPLALYLYPLQPSQPFTASTTLTPSAQSAADYPASQTAASLQ